MQALTRALALIAAAATGAACTGSPKSAPSPGPAVGGAGPGSTAAPPSPESPTMSTMSPGDRAPAPSFVRGPALSPPGPLLAWLEQQQRDGKPRLVRLPVILRAARVGFHLSGAQLGGAPDAATVRVKDTALGIGLGQRAARHCSGQPACAFWVHGYFRGEVDGELQLDVVKVEAHIAAADVAAASFAEVEGDSERGN